MNAAFSTYRRMIGDAVRAAMPELKDVSGHPGRFDLEELRRTSVRAPAVRIAILGAPRIGEVSDERIRATLSMAAFVITKDAPGLPRDEAAVNITEGLIRLVSLNQWQADGQAGFGIGLPEEIRADNVFAAATDRAGVALWAVSWKQTLVLGESIFTPDGVMPWRLYIRENGGAPKLLLETQPAGGNG